MKLPANVKPKIGLWNTIPWISQNTASALYPNVYLPIKIYADLQTTSPDPYNIARLIHEQTHIKRYKKVGPVKFAIKYILDPKFRISEELIATKAGMRFIKSKKLSWDIDRSAKYLSGWLYLWPTSYSNAKTRLEKIWKET